MGGAVPGYEAETGILNTTTSIELLEKPVNYDFKAIFFNPGGDPAKNNAVEVEVHETSVVFNGVPDLDEYIGVTDVDVLNTNLAGTAVPTNEIVASWPDMREKPAGNYISAEGSSAAVTKAQFETLTSYVIYMFVSSSTIGPSGGENYPNKVETNGTWYLLDTVPPSQMMASFRVPQNKTVML